MIYDFKRKDINIKDFNLQIMNKTLAMFEYDGLPDTLPVKELEKLLQINGYAFVTVSIHAPVMGATICQNCTIS